MALFPFDGSVDLETLRMADAPRVEVSPTTRKSPAGQYSISLSERLGQGLDSRNPTELFIGHGLRLAWLGAPTR